MVLCLRGSPRTTVLKTGGKLSTATLPLLRVELGVLYIDSTDGATKPTYAVCHVRCALYLQIAEDLHLFLVLPPHLCFQKKLALTLHAQSTSFLLYSDQNMDSK